MRRRRGGLALIVCLPACLLAGCGVSPGVTATEANNGPPASETSVAETSAPASEPTLPVETKPGQSEPDVPGQTGSPDTSDDYGIGDELFPELGSPGIDVEHYTVRLSFDHATNLLEGTVHLDVVMTADRTSFALDSDGPDVSSVEIDGAATDFEQQSPELVITPDQPLRSGERIGVDVDYSVRPAPVSSPAVGQIGWFTTAKGSYVLNEPDGARTWLPSDDHPSDQATFRFEITVPSGVTAVANGAMVAHTSAGGDDTWIWEEERPMTTYLIQVLTGDYELIKGTGPNGLPLLSAVLADEKNRMRPFVDSIPEQIDFFDDWFGPYPLDGYGVAMADSLPGIAMETMGRSMFSNADFASGRLDPLTHMLLSHELAHQWFGDAVTPRRWTDIWLNESFATYGQWMWLDHVGVLPIDRSAKEALANRPPGSTARPTVMDMFSFNSYDGGAVILHALRKTIGDDMFFTLLRKWVSDNNGTARTTEDFVRTANEVAGQNLDEFFATWLYADVLPATFPS